VQHHTKKPDLWALEPRQRALIEALKRSRNAVSNAEDAIYTDLPVVMALLWFQTPFADIAKAVQMDEPTLEAIFGVPMLDHCRKALSLKPKHRNVR
jgi:hypothetical protein